MNTLEIVRNGFNGSAVALSGKGYSGARLQTLKEYREANNLPRNQAKAAHAKYLLEHGVKANEGLAAEIAGGRILVTGVRRFNSGGLTITAREASSLVVAAPEPAKIDLKAMTAEERDALRKELAALEVKS